MNCEHPSARHWTLEHQIRYPLIAAVAVSPDGRQVAYAAREPLMTEERSAYVHHLYLVPAEGETPVQLTYGAHDNTCPRWSPDGQYLAFLSDRAGEANLYVMRASGGEAWPLTAYEHTAITVHRWAPDGKSIAFLMPEPPSEKELEAERAKDDPILWDEDFDFAHLHRVPFAVGPRALPEVEQLTRGRFHGIDFDWWPDGERLALTHRPTPVDDYWPQTRLALVPATAADAPHNREALTDLGLVADIAAAPKVSPDGAWVACATGEQPARWAFANRVVLYPAAGGDPRPLAPTADEQCWLLGWAADGQHVYAYEYSGTSSQVWALPTSGAAGRPLTDDTHVKGPFDLSAGDHIVFAAQNFHQVNHLYRLDGKSGETHPIARPLLPADWPAAPLPEAEVIHWQAPDGQAIEGIVIYPLDYEPGRRYPLVVEVHGGPAAAFSRRYLAWPERYCDVVGLAQRGVAVLRANPRGSTGYGRAFRFANHADWGYGDYQDILAGVDALIERGLADPERLGIMGWSYGGYMTSWAITQTDRFAAACVGAGVTNLMSFNGTADIPGFVPDYFDAEFWDDLTPYRRHSALFQVQGVRTPTLIQHGAEDVRVPLSQGRELYNALKRQGVPVQMVIYPRQGHGFTEPRLRIDLRRRAREWMVRWLLRDGAPEEPQGA